MSKLHFDIETLPCNDSEVIEQLRQTIKPPATHKKPETIMAWMQDNAEQALADMVAKTSFDGLYGRVACIAWAHDDGEVEATAANHSEGEAIECFYSAITTRNPITIKNIQYCGHNVSGFDLPFLKHRSIILGIKPPFSLGLAMQSKSWSPFILDTMLMWSTDKDKRASMDKLCRAFGLAGKGDFDGSMVAETWPKDPLKVIEYCKDDVRRGRALENRISSILS